MSKSLSYMLIILFTASIVFSQTNPVINIPLTITDNFTSKVLSFGLDPIATDGIDILLGEEEQPPPPPTGVFDARFIGDDIGILQMGQGLVKDYRFGYDTTKAQRIHELRYQVGTGTTITISWTFPTGVVGRLQDFVTGNIINVEMNGSGNYTVTNPNILSKLKMTITYNLTGPSIPSAPTLLSPSNGAINQPTVLDFSWNASSGATSYRLQIALDSLFSDVIFDDSTITTTTKQVTTLSKNKKYFWRVRAKNSAGLSPYSNVWFFFTTFEIGWCNLQWPGSGTITQGDSLRVYAQVWIDGVTNSPGAGSGIQAWIGYSTSNTNPNTWTNWIEARYNVDVGNNDEYMADIGSTLPIGIYYYASRFQFQSSEYKYGGFSPSGGHFWDGSNYISGVLTINPLLPFVPNLLSPLNGAVGVAINPTLIWRSVNNAESYRMQVSTNGTFTQLMVDQSEITDTTFSVTGLSNNTTYFWRVNATNSGGTSDWSDVWQFTTLATDVNDLFEIPLKNELEQNFPNPFSVRSPSGNQSTKISYELRVSSIVKLKVYDILGREVATLVDEYKSAGRHRVIFDTRNSVHVTLSSGVYFYQITAVDLSGNQNFSDIKKMVVVK